MRNKLDTNRIGDHEVVFEPLNSERATAAKLLLRIAILIASVQSTEDLPVIV
jgi:hypothetical protein